jgi:hypothetical protein
MGEATGFDDFRVWVLLVDTDGYARCHVSSST